MTDVHELLADEAGTAVTLDDGTGVLVDWWTFDNRPHIHIEAFLSSGWYELQCDTHSFTATLGRDLTDESVEVGQAEIVVDNRDGRYTRLTDGRLSLTEGTPIRLRLRHPTIGGAFGEGVVWIGAVHTVTHEWSHTENRVRINAVDPLAFLAEQGGALGWRSGDLGDSVPDRLWHLLERVGQVGVRTYFEPDHLVAGLANPELGLVTCLAEAHTTALTDGGRFQAEPTADGDSLSYVYLSRDRIAHPPGQIGGNLTSRTARSTVDRYSPVQHERVSTLDVRPGQPVIHRFSDWCGPHSNGLPYVGLSELTWRGWERPSLVAVSNVLAPETRDADGDVVPPAWPDVGALEPTGSKRHRIVEYTGLRLRKQVDADRVAGFYAELHARANVVIDELVLAPHASGIDNDTRAQLWDAIAGPTAIRQGDWIKVERHLQHDRFVATCTVEGIRYELLPAPDPINDESVWTVVYKLHALHVETTPIPPIEYPPLPSGVPGKPPLPPAVPEITLTSITFTQRGQPPWHFETVINDPAHADHEAFVWNDVYGIVKLNLVAVGTYAGDEVTRQWADVPLAPGEWTLWVRDATSPSRLSDQQVFQVPAVGTIDITAHTWNPDGISTLTVTDDRFPLAKPRIYVDGKQTDEFQVPVTSWQIIGNPSTSTSYTVSFDSSKLLPDEYDIFLRDAVDFTRESNLISVVKDGPAPTNLRLGPFTTDERDVDAWDDIPIAWDAVVVNGVRAEDYRVEYRDVADGTLRSTSSESPMTTLRGGSTSGGQQTSTSYEFRVRATVDGHDGPWSGWKTLDTGYPYLIHRTEYTDLSPPGFADSTSPMAIRLPAWRATVTTPGGATSGNRPAWTQDVDPTADNFVGVHARRLLAHNLRCRGIDGATGTAIEHDRLRFYGNGPADMVRAIIKDVIGPEVTNNPSTPGSATFSLEQAGGGLYGLVFTGTAWGPRGVQGGSWVEFDAIEAKGDLYSYYPPIWPKVT